MNATLNSHHHCFLIKQMKIELLFVLFWGVRGWGMFPALPERFFFLSLLLDASGALCPGSQGCWHPCLHPHLVAVLSQHFSHGF